MDLKSSATCYKQKTNISHYQTTNLQQTRSLLLVCKKEQKEDKSEFVTKSVGIKVMIISCKNISQPVELLLSVAIIFETFRIF